MAPMAEFGFGTKDGQKTNKRSLLNVVFLKRVALETSFFLSFLILLRALAALRGENVVLSLGMLGWMLFIATTLGVVCGTIKEVYDKK
jgi:hypothetical protein